MIDIPCRCGHKKVKHVEMNGDPVGGRSICYFLGSDTTVYECPCFNYIPDNLSYIEQLVKERNLI